MKRIFRPRSQMLPCGLPTLVDRWEWTPSRGLWCYYSDGFSVRSEYSLRELLRLVRPVEVTA